MDTSHNLLRNAKESHSDAWNRFVRVYTPLISRWLTRFGVAASDLPDLTQEVLLAAATDLNKFEHSGRPGAFRTWLRTVALHRCRRHWRQQQRNVSVARSDSISQQLSELADANSELTVLWNLEHDAFVLRGMFEILEREFDKQTLAVFFRLTLYEQKPAVVAKQERLPIGRVYKSKYRVMARLRQLAGKFLD
ncbi:MAG: sigma-70 family RNA polymerase sigma factor [Planctomycetales bacterium]|nr:sigma-70 family RNA polymerase sigma factor [Planctomycetales bacterium]